MATAIPAASAVKRSLSERAYSLWRTLWMPCSPTARTAGRCPSTTRWRKSSVARGRSSTPKWWRFSCPSRTRIGPNCARLWILLSVWRTCRISSRTGGARTARSCTAEQAQSKLRRLRFLHGARPHQDGFGNRVLRLRLRVLRTREFARRRDRQGLLPKLREAALRAQCRRGHTSTGSGKTFRQFLRDCSRHSRTKCRRSPGPPALIRKPRGGELLLVYNLSCKRNLSTGGEYES